MLAANLKKYSQQHLHFNFKENKIQRPTIPPQPPSGYTCFINLKIIHCLVLKLLHGIKVEVTTFFSKYTYCGNLSCCVFSFWSYCIQKLWSLWSCPPGRMTIIQHQTFTAEGRKV